MNMSVPSGNTGNGPLLSIAWALITIWKRYVVLWGWTPLFDRRQTPARHHRTIIDVCWGAMLLASMGSLWLFHHGQNAQWSFAHKKVLAGLAALASFRAFDLLVNAAAYAPFGPATWGGRYRNRDEHCRIMLLTVMNFVELVLWYTVLFAYLAWFCGARFIYPGYDAQPAQPFAVQHAFVLATSTITTVGYGTVAPNDMVTTVLAGVLSLSGLLLIAVGIASAVSFAVSSLNPEPAVALSDLSLRNWTIRRFSPPLCSGGILIVLYWLFLSAVMS